MLARNAIAAAALAVSMSSPVIAASENDTSNAEHFVRGSLRSVIYHELGHLLIEEYEIPVLGRNEDAADSYAAFALASRGLDASEVVAPIDFWRVMARLGPQDRAKIQWWDEHGTNEQRAYRFACLLAGAHPDRYGALPELMGIPKEAMPSCAAEAERNAKSWHTALDQYNRRHEDQGNLRVGWTK